MAKSVDTNSTVVTFHSRDVSPELFEKLKTSPAKRHVQGSTITVDLDKLSGSTKFQLAREVSDLWVLTALIADDDPEICLAACVNPAITVKQFKYLSEHSNASDEYRYHAMRVQAMLALSTHEDVRYFLASQPDLWVQTQWILALDTDLSVRETLFRNNTLNHEIRMRITKEFPNLTRLMKEAAEKV